MSRTFSVDFNTITSGLSTEFRNKCLERDTGFHILCSALAPYGFKIESCYQGLGEEEAIAVQRAVDLLTCIMGTPVRAEVNIIKTGVTTYNINFTY